MDESACEPFHSLFSFYHNTVGLVGTSPVGLQNQILWDLVSPLPVLKFGMSAVGYNLFPSQREGPGFGGHHVEDGIYDKIMSQPFFILFNVISLSFFQWEGVASLVSFFSRGNCSI